MSLNLEFIFARGSLLMGFILSILLILPWARASAIEGHSHQQIMSQVVGRKLPFVQNLGQIKNRNIRYYAETGNGNLYLSSRDQLIYSCHIREKRNAASQWVVSERFVGASKFNITVGSKAIGGDPGYTQDYAHALFADSIGVIYVAGTTGSPAFPSTPKAYDPRVSYFRGPDPLKWKSAIPGYNRTAK